MPVCDLDWKIQGPYNQTLFLGCSIRDFNINLGWKGEASTCTVKLVRDRAKHPSASSYSSSDTFLNTIVSNTNNSTLFDPQINSPDNSKSLTKNVAQKLVDIQNTRLTEDITQIMGDSEHSKDTGKVAWVLPDKTQKIWTESDPGFAGKEGYSIIGCPVYFKFHNIEFGGYIKTWTDNRNDTFDVELSSFGSLLGGCKLILQKYRGSVSTLLNTTGGLVAVPYGNPQAGDSNGTIANGNIPNLFNIFGWLENQGFGFSSASEDRGIPAIKVYNALQIFLGSVNPGPFSPYGGILSKGVSLSDSNLLINTKTATIGSLLKLTECGFLPTITGTDGLNRCLFLLDIGEVPPPPDIVFLNQTEISIIDFIDTCCEGAGFDYFVDLIPGDGSTYSGIIKIRTVSRRIQPPVNILRTFIDSISSGNGKVLSVSVGEEFSDSQVRSVVVGGQQERLYQVCCHTLSRYRNHNRYDPEDGLGVDAYSSNLSVANLSAGNTRNTIRSPLGSRTRWYDYAFIDGAVVAQETDQTQYFLPENLGFSTMSVYTGGYETSTPSLGSSFGNSSSYPLYADLISPYFGRDSQGFLRKVFFDTNTSQLQIVINTQDIKSCFPTFNISGNFLVYENELRAALSGIDPWLTYISETSKYGASTFTAGLIFAYLNSTYGPLAAKALFMSGLGVIRSPGKTSALPSIPPTNNPLRPDSSISYTGPILDVLQKLHNFFRNLADKHYGKEFLVRLPLAQTSVDSSNVRQYDYTITETGWEEPGNFIDDTIPIGTSLADNLMQEDGKFGVILGYNNLGEKYTILDTSGQGIIGLLNKLRGAFTTNTWYFPLTTEIDPREVYVAQWGTATLPGSFPATNNPWVSRNPIVNNQALLSTSIFPASYTTGFGDNIDNDAYKYKIYVKGSCQDVASENKYNKKMIYDSTSNTAYCVVSAPGKVWINSPRSLAITIIEDLLLSNSSAVGSLSQNRLLVQWAACLNNLPAMINSTTPSTNSMEIAPRAALPCFAAVPVKLNRFTYGPWSSHPYLIRNLIFPGAMDTTAMTNNIIGGVKVEIDPQLVPWNYGGIEQLDFAALNKIASDNNYQQIIEKGSITYAGIQMGQNGIGYRLINANMGPIINSIVVSVGQEGIKTTLSLRTYSRKLGFYNKEAADNIQKIATESIKRRKEISDNIRSLSFASNNNNISSDFANSRPKALNWSPVSILVGNAYPFLHNNSTIDDASAPAGLSYTPSWHLRPKIPANVISSPSNLIRHQTQASIYDPGELPAVFKDVSYSGTSIMSMDGLLSPISFYPTLHGSTYAISPYSRSSCPYCEGEGTYSYEGLNLTTLDNGTPATFGTLKSKVVIKTEPCRFCVPDNNKQILRQKSAKPVEHLPPFIVATGTDLSIINNSQNIFAANSPIINRYTLNPMVMSNPASEFSCTTNKQVSDSCAHSIDAVAFGNTLDEAAGGLRAHLSNTINSNYGNNNVRFFGLRGPIMVHAWGYDTEGYPVPNASGEFKIENGNIVRDPNNNPVFKNQILQSDGTYSAPYKENAFFKGWAQLPSTWPVGPIDLRWDNDAGVWSIGSNYKPMWVVLENDLVSTAPVRGTILEGYADNEPLPNGLRKLVFVKDSTKLFSAPRGAAIYCKYNSSNGFYEPIYNQPFITSGVINGSSLATIYKAYNASTITPDDSTPSSYQTNFVNPLELNVGINNVGLFIYLNGNWTLQSVKN